MADDRPPLAIERTTSELDYRPPSGAAVASIVVAGAYSLVVIGTALAAIIQKRPALNISLALFAIPSVALAIAARLHVRRSEGTRVGLRLASIAWWLSVLGGVGFGAYIFASVVAIRQQSEQAASDWFAMLKEGDINGAFVMTIPPLHRQTINPKDVEQLESRFGGGLLPGFRNSELVRFFRRNGQDVDIKPLGMSDWEQIDNGYRVNLAFRLRNPEGEFEVSLFLTGVEEENFVGRQWQITMPDGSLTARGRTPYGWVALDLEREARAFASDWIANLRNGAIEESFLATLPAASQPEPLARLVARRVNQLAPGWGAIASDRRSLVAAQFDDLWKREFFKLARSEPTTSANQNTFRKIWEQSVILAAGSMRLLNSDTAPTLSIRPEAIEYTFPVEVRLPGEAASFAKGRLVLVCDSPQFVAEANELKASSRDNFRVFETPPAGGLSAMAPREWRVARLESDLEPLQAPSRPDR